MSWFNFSRFGLTDSEYRQSIFSLNLVIHQLPSTDWGRDEYERKEKENRESKIKNKSSKINKTKKVR